VKKKCVQNLNCHSLANISTNFEDYKRLEKVCKLLMPRQQCVSYTVQN